MKISEDSRPRSTAKPAIKSLHHGYSTLPPNITPPSACESHQLTSLCQPSQVHRSSKKPPAHHQKVFGAFALYGVMTNSSTTQCKENQYMQVVGKESFTVCPNHTFPFHLPLLQRSQVQFPHLHGGSQPTPVPGICYSLRTSSSTRCLIYIDKHAANTQILIHMKDNLKIIKTKGQKWHWCLRDTRLSVSPVGRCACWFPVLTHLRVQENLTDPKSLST